MTGDTIIVSVPILCEICLKDNIAEYAEYKCNTWSNYGRLYLCGSHFRQFGTDDGFRIEYKPLSIKKNSVIESDKDIYKNKKVNPFYYYK